MRAPVSGSITAPNQLLLVRATVEAVRTVRVLTGKCNCAVLTESWRGITSMPKFDTVSSPHEATRLPNAADNKET